MIPCSFTSTILGEFTHGRHFCCYKIEKLNHGHVPVRVHNAHVYDRDFSRSPCMRAVQSLTIVANSMCPPLQMGRCELDANGNHDVIVAVSLPLY